MASSDSKNSPKFASNTTLRKSQNKLSRKKFETLKLSFNTRAKNKTIPEQDLEFKLTFEGEDLEVIYSRREKTICEILIRRPENDTNCVVLSYNRNTRTIQFESLLGEVPKDDKCRINKSGAYYIDIIFMVIKLLQTYPKIEFNPCLIELYDAATKKIFNFDHQNRRLSAYKLLTDGRTFYEGYGFIPTELADCSSNVNYEKLENLISIRTDILNLPIKILVSYIQTLKLEDQDSDIPFFEELIYELNKIIELAEKNDLTNLEKSLSEIFKQLVQTEEPNMLAEELCIAIYDFVYIKLPKLFDKLKLVVSSAHVFSYVITSDKTHYAKISEIYAKYNIQRYEEYANYLQIIQKESTKKN